MPLFGKRRVAAYILLPLIVVALLNLAAGLYLRENTPNEGYLRIYRKWAMLQNLQQPVDTLIIGDSSGAQGVDPEILEQAFGGEAINLCTIADMTVVNSAAMLDEYMRKFGPPKRVVLVHVYDIWQRDMTGYALARTPFSPWSTPESLSWYSIPQGERREWLAGRYLPLFAENKSLMQVGKEMVRGGRPRGKGPREDGFSVSLNPDPKQLERDYKMHTQDAPKPGKLSADNKAALEHIAELARKHGFPVYLVNSPVYEKVWLDDGFRIRYGKVISEVDQVVRQNPSITYLYPEPATFPTTHMTNVDHLTYEGAQQFTKELVQRMEAKG